MKDLYLRISIFLLLIMGLLVGIHLSILNSKWDNIGIVNFQVDKLKKNKGRHFKKIYIGDSSGGYAIQTQSDEELNLCLSGSFGFIGLKEFMNIVDAHITYDSVVQVTAIDVLTREVNREAVNIVNLHSENFIDGFISAVATLKYFRPVLKTYVNEFVGIRDVKALNIDYPYSNKRKRSPQIWVIKDINVENLKELKKLQYKFRNKDYFFFFGPHFNPDKVLYGSYSDYLKKKGIVVSSAQPFVLDKNSIGDDEFHTHPTYRKITTRYYIDKLNEKK